MRRASCIFSQAFTDIHLRFQLLASGRIKGELSGKRFTPDAFIQAQKRAVKDFFQSNGCISWSRVEALQVTPELFPLSRTLLRPLVSQTSLLSAQCSGLCSWRCGPHRTALVDCRFFHRAHQKDVPGGLNSCLLWRCVAIVPAGLSVPSP